MVQDKDIVGWTRQSNLDGFINGTYDVINFWRRGPDVESMSDVPVFVSSSDNRKRIGWVYESNYNNYMSDNDNVIACWPTQPKEKSVELFVDLSSLS